VLLDAQNGIIQIIIEKMLLTHAKPGIKAKSLECLLLLFEVTQAFDDSTDALQTLLKHKNVKVSFLFLNIQITNNCSNAKAILLTPLQGISLVWKSWQDWPSFPFLLDISILNFISRNLDNQIHFFSTII